MKKLSILSILVLVFCFLFTSNLFADGDIFEQFYPVKEKGSFEETHTFEYTDTPYLYAVLPAPTTTAYKTELFSGWTFGGVTTDADGSGLRKLQYWIDVATWTGIKMSGTWTIDGQFNVYNAFSGALLNSGTGNTWFTVNSPVVPEPISSVLFLLGGAALASRKLFKKNKRS